MKRKRNWLVFPESPEDGDTIDTDETPELDSDPMPDDYGPEPITKGEENNNDYLD